MKTLAEQLNTAFRAKGWTLEHLITESGMDLSRWSMMRKLRGSQKLTTEECEKLATVLGVTVAWTPPEPMAAKAKRRVS